MDGALEHNGVRAEEQQSLWREEKRLFVNPVHLEGSCVKHPLDYELLCLSRVFSKVVLTSGKNVELEANWNPFLDKTSISLVDDIPFQSLPQTVQRDEPQSLLSCLTNSEVIVCTRRASLLRDVLCARGFSSDQLDHITFVNDSVPAILRNKRLRDEASVLCLEAGPSSWEPLYSDRTSTATLDVKQCLIGAIFHVTNVSELQMFKHQTTFAKLSSIPSTMSLSCLLQGFGSCPLFSYRSAEQTVSCGDIDLCGSWEFFVYFRG